MSQASQTVVVTGASAGIGRATAELFGARGPGWRDRPGGGRAARAADAVDYRAARRCRCRWTWPTSRRSTRLPSRPTRARPDRRRARGVHLGVRPVRADPRGVPPGHRRRPTWATCTARHGGAEADGAPRPRQCRSGRRGSNGRSRCSPRTARSTRSTASPSSVRCERPHDGSNVAVTRRADARRRTRAAVARPRHPQRVPPIYQPEVAAEGVVFAADHPRRKEYWVGGSTVAYSSSPRSSPRRCSTPPPWPGPGTTRSRRASGRPRSRRNNLWQPVDQPGTDQGAHGSFDDRSGSQRAPRGRPGGGVGRVGRHPGR